MKDKLNKLFCGAGIEYFGALAYSDVYETKSHLRERCGFQPKSVFIYLIPYFVDFPKNISVYAASYDYHAVLHGVNGKLISGLSSLYPTARFSGFGDHSPIDERRAALDLGLGVRGDNGLILNEKYGSYVFIGDILTDIEPHEIFAATPSPHGECLHCGLCAAACPTGILRGESDSCLSAITQRKGELTEEEADLLIKVGTVWGCDECQRYCPYNRENAKTPIAAFYEKRVSELTRQMLQNMSDEEFSCRAFSWRGRGVLERNLALFEENERKM